MHTCTCWYWPFLEKATSQIFTSGVQPIGENSYAVTIHRKRKQMNEQQNEKQRQNRQTEACRKHVSTKEITEHSITRKYSHKPEQAMNVPHGDTTAHVFGTWCVSILSSTSPVSVTIGLNITRARLLHTLNCPHSKRWLSSSHDKFATGCNIESNDGGWGPLFVKQLCIKVIQ